MLSLSAPCQYSHFRILDQLMVFQYFNLNELVFQDHSESISF